MFQSYESSFSPIRVSLGVNRTESTSFSLFSMTSLWEVTVLTAAYVERRLIPSVCGLGTVLCASHGPDRGSSSRWERTQTHEIFNAVQYAENGNQPICRHPTPVLERRHNSGSCLSAPSSVYHLHGKSSSSSPEKTA